MLQKFTLESLQKFTRYNIIFLMKYKKLTPEQIKISLDRLTRFKFTREKYLRVFSDIILSNLIEPKIKKNELLNYPAEKIKKIASLHPDLIIVSFGTNEAHSRRYLAQAHKMQIGRLLGMLKAACPEAAFLLTTPPGAYVGRRRARTINPRTVTAARIIKEYAQENKMAVWDMYNIVGGKTDACRNWTKHHMLRADGIHFTPDGYRLQGNLLHQALIKAYNEYVATGLE